MYDVKVESKVTVNYTADEWQLFTASMDCKNAAIALNKAASKALSCGNSSRAWQIFDEAAAKYAAYGASDSEPVYEFGRLVARVYGD